MILSELPELALKKGADRRLHHGHLWVFSNEVDTAATPLTGFQPGDLARLLDYRRQPLGTAYVNPASLISARVLTRDNHTAIDHAFLARRIKAAWQLRQRCYPAPYYRLVYGDSDGLPGLVVDRYGDVLAVQSSTAGMDRLLDKIVAVLEELLQPRAVVLKNTSGLRRLEGLTEETRIVSGTLQEPVEIQENGARFQVDLVGGQKTGWFYDHRDNRRDLAALCQGKRVLDLFSYSGAWGVTAAVHGAKEVVCVDSSASALALVESNAALNGMADTVSTIACDVFDFLKQARETKDRFDVVVLDPPALIKRKKDLKTGSEAYYRLNQAAMQILNYDGILASASCSHHLARDTLQEILRAGARHVDRHLLILKTGGHAADHPIHPAIPETEYLKAFLCHVTASL
ncbi:MAG: class I SAM-dependent rRNA methyltransferase [Methylococcaceae bacterium]|nr:MAG: class I SAM-dependent rRNA methyltransferase [Methylococcaceae bacterium]